MSLTRICETITELQVSCPGHSFALVLACDKEHGHADPYHHDWEFDISWKLG